MLRTVVSIVLLVALAATPAAAQGKGKGSGKTKTGSGPATSGSAAPTATSVVAADGAGVRQFAAWLDDASVITPGAAWTSISLGHYRSLGSSQTDFPVVDAGFGISTRAQFGITVPYYRVHFFDGTNAGGLGDVFLSGKVLLLDRAGGSHPVRLAISPIIEISQDGAPGRGNVAWAAPVNLELRGSNYRLFGSSGYFSRGTVFGSGAIEMPVTDRLVVTSALTMMRSVKDDAVADGLGLSKGRVDVTASAAFFMTPSLAIFGGTGRTVGNGDGTGTTLMLTAGMSVTFAPQIRP